MAVNIGARVGALAGPGEVLVSSTVRELVVGSGIEFEDRGVTPSRARPASGTCSRWRDEHLAGRVRAPSSPRGSRRSAYLRTRIEPRISGWIRQK